MTMPAPHPDESEDRKLFKKMITDYESREDKTAKGKGPKEMSYVAGGPVLGRQRDFMKEPDVFRTDSGPGAKQDYSSKAGEKGKTKSETKQYKPRS
jgi:hypothetical protein